jgi:hypothetical protein
MRVFVLQAQQSRLASLYLPLLSIILENKHRLTPATTPAGAPDSASVAHSSLSTATDSSSTQPPPPVRFGMGGHFDSSVSLDRVTIASSLSGHSGVDGGGGGGGGQGQARSASSLPRYQKDPSVFAMIAGQGSNKSTCSMWPALCCVLPSLPPAAAAQAQWLCDILLQTNVLVQNT